MPPAAYWAAQGKMSFWGVVAAGTAGSYLGSAVSYWVAQWVGTPVVRRWGKFFLMPPSKVELAELWVRRKGAGGIFFARLLPVIRHLISIPAGILHMPFLAFSIATTTGSFLWCAILAWFGAAILGDHPELLDSPADLVHAVKGDFIWFVAAVLLLAALYFALVFWRARAARDSAA